MHFSFIFNLIIYLLQLSNQFNIQGPPDTQGQHFLTLEGFFIVPEFILASKLNFANANQDLQKDFILTFHPFLLVSSFSFSWCCLFYHHHSQKLNCPWLQSKAKKNLHCLYLLHKIK